MGQPPSPIVVDGEEEFKVEAILRHKGSGACVSIRCCGKVIPSPRLVGSLNRTSATLLKSSRNICTAPQPRRQDVGDSGIEATKGLLDGVPKELLCRCRSLGWVQRMMGHHMWREIVFSAPSLHLLPKVCSCTDDCHIQD